MSFPFKPGFMLVLLVGLCFKMTFAAGEPTPILNPVLSAEQVNTAKELKAQIMAPCCWNGTVDTHNSPIANKISRRIDQWVAQGRTSEEIKNDLVATYGERILARPRAKGFGMFFYLGPAIAVLITGLLLGRWLRKLARTDTGHNPQTVEGRSGQADEDPLMSERFEQQLQKWD